MQKVNDLRIGIGLYQFALRENIIKMIIVWLLNVLKATFVERLNKVITCTLHQRRAVWELSRKHIRKVDTKLRFTTSFRHGDGQKVQFSLKNFLVSFHIPSKVKLRGRVWINPMIVRNGVRIETLSVVAEYRCSAYLRTY